MGIRIEMGRGKIYYIIYLLFKNSFGELITFFGKIISSYVSECK